MPKKKLTPKQRVLKKHPQAYAYYNDIEWRVYPKRGASYMSAIGADYESEAKAWANAATGIK